MASLDAVTFAIGFSIIFLGLGLHAWLLDRRTRRMEERVASLERAGEGKR